MSFETKAASGLEALNSAANTVMTPQIKSSIQGFSVVGALTWVIPLFGIETIFYIIVLWGMYAKVAKLAGRKFNFSAIAGGFIVNIMICLVSNVVLEFLDVFFGLGFILAAICGYCATYQSGKSFLGVLQKMG